MAVYGGSYARQINGIQLYRTAIHGQLYRGSFRGSYTKAATLIYRTAIQDRYTVQIHSTAIRDSYTKAVIRRQLYRAAIRVLL